MFKYLVTLALAVGACARPYPTSPVCEEVQIPVSVSVPRFILNVNDDWDAASLTFNLTRRDSGYPTDPLPIAGMTASPVNSTYMVGATVCGTGGPTLVLTHGIIESKLYWRPTFEGAEKYSFVDAAVKAGYSVLSYDRIGVGSSSKISALDDAQFQVETAVLGSLVTYARGSRGASKVALVGHSYGAYISAQAAALSPGAVDAVVLTGFGGSFTWFGPFVAGAGFRVARLRDPARWGALDAGYLTSSDLFAETYAYFAAPHFERRAAEWSYGVGSEPFAVGELPSLLGTTTSFDRVEAPVLVVQGQFDVSACGGNCVGVLDGLKDHTFTSAKTVETVDDLPAGHNLNLHEVAPQAFERIFDFLKAQGV